MTEQEQWFSNEKRQTLLQERYFSGTHNYFFEVKVANNGSKYIIVTQRKKVGDKYVGVKMRIFEDELLEFQRVLNKLIHFALNDEQMIQPTISSGNLEPTALSSDLLPPFFNKLQSTKNWQEFEEYSCHLLKLLGIQTIYSFLGERQAGKADGFFKFGNLAVIYDCTLDGRNIEENKKEQIINYANRLNQGSIEITGSTTEEFYHHHRQIWIISQGKTRRIKLINSIEVKEIAIQDIMNIYRERLTTAMNDQSLEIRLRNL